MIACRRGIVAASLSGAILVSGCAVLQIDVDVYKGPLANHEQVQVQQLATLTTAARPLLVSLRDQLAIDHWKTVDGKGRDPEKDETYRRKLDKECRLMSASRHVRDLLGTNCKAGAQAQRINALLTLYEDDPPGAVFERRLESAISAYRDAEDVLKRSDRQDAARWGRLKSGLIPVPAPDTEIRRHYGITAASRADIQKIDDGRQRLQEAYRLLLDQSNDSKEYFRAKLLPQAYGEFAAAFPGNAPPDIAPILGYAPIQAGFPGTSPNAIYHALSDRNRVTFHAALLFTDPHGAPAREFVMSVLGIGEAFVRARRALQQMLEVALDAAIALNDEAKTVSVEKHAERQKTLTDLILAVIQPEHVVAATCLEGAPQWLLQSSRANWKTLRDGAKWPSLEIATDGSREPPTEQANEKEESESRRQYSASLKETKKVLQGLLDQDLAGTAAQLRQLHNFARAASPSPSFSNDCPGVGAKFTGPYSERLAYGLARGPSIASRIIAAKSTTSGAPNQVEDEVSKIVTAATAAKSAMPPGIGLGFEDGRLPVGIVRRIEDYLNAIDYGISVGNPGAAKPALEALIDDLVRFAEKLLFIANNEFILNAGTMDKTAFGPTIDPYVLGLQAIGNHILVATNELRERAAHKNVQRARAPAERAATRRALLAPPTALLGNVISGLERKARDAAAEESAKKTELKRLGFEESLSLTDAASKISSATSVKTQAEQRLKDAKALQGQVADAQRMLSGTALQELKNKIIGNDQKSKAKISPSEFLSEVKDWIAQNKIDVNFRLPADDGEIKAWKNVQTYIGNLLDPGDEAEPKSHFDSFFKGLAANAGIAQRNVEAGGKEVGEKSEALAAATKAKALATERDDKNKESADSRKAVERLQENRADLLAKMLAPGSTVAPAVAWDALKQEIKRRIGASQGEDEKGAWGAVDKYISPRQAPLIADAADADAIANQQSSDESARDVLDRLIAALRVEELMALREGGESSEHVKNVRDAIRAAYDQRAGMAYIRPPSAYLRSSNAATLFQEDPGLRWRNMLGGLVTRSLPLIGSSLVNYEDEERLKALTNVDKQFWQNINSVRVAGGGRTNYAVVKDDLGNWYVKGMSSDASDVIKSAKNLALFNIGAKLGTNLVPKAPPTTGTSGGPAGTNAIKTDTEKNALERAFDKFKGQYVDATAKHFEQARTLVGGEDGSARATAQAAVDGSSLDPAQKTSLSTLIAGAQTSQLAPVAKDMKANDSKADPAAGQAGLVVDAIRALRRFRDQVKSGIANSLPDNGDVEKKDAARTLATSVAATLNDQMRRLTDDRRATAGAFESQVLVLSEATK